MGSLEDLSNSVSLHVAVMLETIHPNCLVVVYDSLISQFDKFPSDRLLIIHTFRLLHNALPKRTPLSGHFFLKRFTQLFVEKTSLVASSNPTHSTLSRQANMSDKSSMSNTSSMVETSRKTGKGIVLSTVTRFVQVLQVPYRQKHLRIFKLGAMSKVSMKSFLFSSNRLYGGLKLLLNGPCPS